MHVFFSLTRAGSRAVKVWGRAKLKSVPETMLLLYSLGMPLTAYFLVSSVSPSVTVIPVSLVRWARFDFIGLSIPSPRA